MRYLNEKPFPVGGAGEKKYEENYSKIFGKIKYTCTHCGFRFFGDLTPDETPVCLSCKNQGRCN